MPYGDTRDFPSQLLHKADHVAHLISRTQVTVAQGSPHREEASEDSLVPPPEQDLYSSPTHSRHRRGLRPARPIGTANPLTTETGSRHIPSQGPGEPAADSTATKQRWRERWREGEGGRGKGSDGREKREDRALDSALPGPPWASSVLRTSESLFGFERTLSLTTTRVWENALPHLAFVPGRPDLRTCVSSGGPPGKVMDAGWKSRARGACDGYVRPSPGRQV